MLPLLFPVGKILDQLFLCNLGSPVDSRKVLNLKLVLFFFCSKVGRNTFSRSLYLEAKVVFLVFFFQVFFKTPVSGYTPLNQMVEECLFCPLHMNDLTWKYRIV